MTDADEFRFQSLHWNTVCLMMGYHVLPSIRDYWSTQPDLQVPFIANTITVTITVTSKVTITVTITTTATITVAVTITITIKITNKKLQITNYK